jgi:hypothetical protein
MPGIFSCTQREEIQAGPSGRKGTFVGYSESSKAYQIYIPGQRQIEISKNVTFEEEIAFQRSRESQMEIDSETIPSPPSAVQKESDITVDPVVLADPVAPIDVPKDIAVGHKSPAWARQTL